MERKSQKELAFLHDLYVATDSQTGRKGDSPVDGTQLKAVQEPLKEKYRNDPASALITLRAEGRASGLSCKVETGKALIEAGLHPATGGDGTAACSGDMLLEALVACAGVTLRAVATSIGIDLRDAKVLAEGDLDFRGTLGVSKDAPVGFVKIRLRFEVDTDASEEQTATLLKLTERYCVVLQTLRVPGGLQQVHDEHQHAARDHERAYGRDLVVEREAQGRRIRVRTADHAL
jgi:uncharacterized OsmC-like protein